MDSPLLRQKRARTQGRRIKVVDCVCGPVIVVLVVFIIAYAFMFGPSSAGENGDNLLTMYGEKCRMVVDSTVGGRIVSFKLEDRAEMLIQGTDNSTTTLTSGSTFWTR